MINIQNLNFGYNRENLFNNLDLSLAPGSISGLLGKNGAGKTTLLKLMAGLLFPREGSINIMEQNPAERSPYFLQDLFFLPEEFELPDLSPGLYSKLYAPFYPAFDFEKYQNFLSEFELPQETKFKNLSFGQKKKFLLSFGFASGSRFLLLDEPTNGLDIPSKSQLRRIMASEAADDSAIIISTHQVRDLENLIDPVIILDEGQIIFNHSMEEINSRLRVTHEADPPEPESVLYMEKTLNGYITVSENRTSEESNINLETLFTTVLTSRDKILSVFKGGRLS
ncbi:ATP-binding cassette domain-containing protein [Thermodesulfobacteriota bacterium]